MQTVTLSPKFQVVIPAELRRQLNLQPGCKLVMMEFNGSLRLMPLKTPQQLRGIARGINPTVIREADRLP